MRNPSNRPRTRLQVEVLEPRELLSSSSVVHETFDSTQVGTLPGSWDQWSSQGVFAVAPAIGNHHTAGVSDNAATTQNARAWVSAAQPADVQVSVSAYINGLIPAQVLLRGSQLDSSAPTYYAVSVTRGLQVQLLRVVNGSSTTLAQGQSAGYLSNLWVRLSITATGSQLQAQVQRLDTNQYLAANGQWQSSATAALTATDSSITSGGLTGVNRPASYPGSLSLDDFTVQGVSSSHPTYVQESFDSTSSGAMPATWYQWSDQGPIAVSTANAHSGSRSLVANAGGGVSARAWYSTPAAADAQASAAIFVNSLLPGEVLLRGSNLLSSSPTYYAASVARGLQVQLLRVVNGTSTVLGTINSASYFSGQWVQVSLSANGSSLQVQVQRLDTNQYLAPNGQWQSSAVAALSLSDTSITGSGQAGLIKAADYGGTIAFDDFTVTQSSSGGSGGGGSGTVGSAKLTISGVTNGSKLSGPTTITAYVSNPSQPVDHVEFWLDGIQTISDTSAPYRWTLDPSTVSGGSHSLTVKVFAQGGLLTQTTLSVTTNGGSSGGSGGGGGGGGTVGSATLTISGITNGSKLSGPANITAYVSNPSQPVDHVEFWLDGTRTASDASAPYRWTLDPSTVSGGSHSLTVKVLAQAGLLTQTTLNITTNGGSSGGSGGGGGGGTVGSATVTLSGITNGSKLSGPATVTAYVSNPSQPVDHVEFWLDNNRAASDTSAPYRWTIDPSAMSSGSHTVTVIVYAQGGVLNRTTVNITTNSSGGSGTGTGSGPNIPRHYTHIRIAELAYSGTPLDSALQTLLQNSVDLVIPNTAYLDDIHAVAPNTPQLIYTNVSSLYQNLLTDWLDYADAHGANRESAFYHVSAATQFSGSSASSQPVTWFWGVFQGGETAGFNDVTVPSHSTTGQKVPFDATGTSMYIGYPDKFREINFNLALGAHDGWSAVVEYPTGVDADGNPTTWATLKLLSDTTNGLVRSGQMLFDPPSNWKTISINGSPLMYYVRIRTLTDGTPPIANTILGRDYVGAHGGTSGTIPAFDYSADTNHDGYLSDAEYAHRQKGMDARFVYESRLFQGNYGQMRVATNPSNAAFQNWAVDYHLRLLKSEPNAAGLFVDNSGGKAPVGYGLLEPISSYSTDYGALLHAVGKAIAPHWLVANTSGGGTNSDGVVSQNTGYFEEFALRPLQQNFQAFEDLAALIAHRASLQSHPPYAILDSLPAGGSPTDSRTQLATLAEYYLLADPVYTFLDFYGGFEPSTDWSRHWAAAAAYNVGQPTGTWSLFATGADPENHNLTYRVYQRTYTNALILYKPLSHAQGVTRDGTLDGNTWTTFHLNGQYRLLHADGTLGSVTSSVSLRNGEGAILIKA